MKVRGLSQSPALKLNVHLDKPHSRRITRQVATSRFLNIRAANKKAASQRSGGLFVWMDRR
jgi:hypothetical protein